MKKQENPQILDRQLNYLLTYQQRIEYLCKIHILKYYFYITNPSQFVITHFRLPLGNENCPVGIYSLLSFPSLIIMLC